jgi:hypothetical protein
MCLGAAREGKLFGAANWDRHRPRENMENTTPLTDLAAQLPPDWKWVALFHAPEGFEREWRAWLGAAVHEEDLSLLRWWGQRADRAA